MNDAPWPWIMSLSSLNEIEHKSSQHEASPAPQLDASQSGSDQGSGDHQEHRIGRRMPRWPLVAIALAALITLIWNALLIWALIEVVLS
jgi:type VI protein secretion system component VasF